MANRQGAFTRYVDAYRRAIQAVSYDDLAALQRPPFATIAHGGAGTAMALLRLDERAAARRWVARGQRDRRQGAFAGTGYLDGRIGAELVLAKTAARSSRDLARAARGARRVIGGPREVFGGSAGVLIGASLLLRSNHDRALARVANDLSDALEEASRRRARRAWSDRDPIGFAHGWSGQLYALLLFRQAVARPIEPWMESALAHLASAWRPGRAKHASLLASWCGGDAGAAILWCKAFELVRDVRFRRAAIAAARSAMRNEPEKAHICCGKGAVAYALLSVDRIDPDRGWRDKAREVGARAIQTPLVSRWPNGLLWGHPGLVCLALDLMAETPRGFPLIEG